MPTRQTKHTFHKGMVLDTDKSVVDPNTYEDTYNFRYLADNLGNTGKLYVPNSSSILIEDFEHGERIIGHCVIRNYLVLFTYIDEDDPDDIRRIRRYEISDKTLINGALLYQGDTSGDTAFSKTEVLSTVGRYESEDIIKIYWATKGYPIRMANIAEYLTTDGLVKSGSNSYLDVNRFDLITNFNIVPSTGELIEVNNMVSGGLYTGRVQYAISLIKNNGQETTISQITTSPINIFNDNLITTPSAKISGDAETILTNKGVNLNFNFDSEDISYFDKYRLYRIHYTEYGQLPEITIVNDFLLNEDSNSCTDVGGVGLGEITTDEFSLLTGIQYEAYEINEKDNRLIAANLVEQTWDVDWDARAYRFKITQVGDVYGIITSVIDDSFYVQFNQDLREQDTSINILFDNFYTTYLDWSYTSKVYNGDGTVTYQLTMPAWLEEWSSLNTYTFGQRVDDDDIYYISNAGGNLNNIPASSPLLWVPIIGLGTTATSSTGTISCNIYDDYSLTSATVVTPLNWGSINSTHNAVNAFNDIRNDGVAEYRYMYQSDGSNRGAEGPNVTITCNSPLVNGLVLDSSTYQTTSSTTFSSTSSALYPSSSITDYSYPIVAKETVGYQRDEVYRFAIVLINNKGQRSTPKWSCDFRFPTSIATGISSYSILSVGSDLEASVMGINITVSNLPSGTVAWELVRVPREESDKTVLRAGAVIDTYTNSGNYTCRVHSPVFAENLSFINNQVVNFITPENIYNNDSVIESGDYLDIVEASNTTLTYEASTSARVRGYKFPEYDAYTDYTNKRYQIEQSEFVTPAYTNTEENDYYFDDAENGIYRGWLWSGSTALKSAHGRSNVFNLDSPISNTLNLHTSGIGYGYVKRNSIGRYGGYTYSDKINNTYISCGEPTSSTSSVVFYGGDTYINYFNYMYSMLTDFTDGDTVSLLFPVESTLNLNLAHGALISKNHENFFSLSSNKFLTREEAGVHTVGSYTLTQDKDLYLYNTIYSQEQNIKKDVGYYDSELLSSYDTRVTYSDYKLDNETIDSWAKFRSNNYIDVTGTYGPIYKLTKYNNNLYFIQEKAFGVLPINQRALVTDNNIGTLELGTGDVLSRYDYINIYYGTQDKSSCDTGNTGTYFIDKSKRCLLRFNTNGIKDLGILKGVSSYFKPDEYEGGDTINTIPLVSVNDYENEVYINYRDERVLLFNSIVDNFISIYTYNIDYMGLSNDITFYQATSSDNNVYGKYAGDIYGMFEDGVYVDSSIQFIDNSDFFNTKVYDNFKFFTNYDIDGVDQYETTFDTALFKNDYQYTGDVTLTVGGSLQRRERELSMDVPRNIVKTNETVNNDITDPLNHNTFRQFKERMRDKYIDVTLTFNNDIVKSQGRLSIPYAILTYRKSSR